MIIVKRIIYIGYLGSHTLDYKAQKRSPLFYFSFFFFFLSYYWLDYLTINECLFFWRMSHRFGLKMFQNPINKRKNDEYLGAKWRFFFYSRWLC